MVHRHLHVGLSTILPDDQQPLESQETGGPIGPVIMQAVSKGGGVNRSDR